MKKVDRLLIQVKEAYALSDEALIHALIAPACFLEEPEDSPNYNKWEVVAWLSRTGKTGDGTQHISYYDTEEEAMEAARALEELHKPKANRAKLGEATFIVIGTPEPAQPDGADEINRLAEEGQRELEKIADAATTAMKGALS